MLLQNSGTCTRCLQQAANVRVNWLASSLIVSLRRHKILFLLVFCSRTLSCRCVKYAPNTPVKSRLHIVFLSVSSDQFHKAGRPELSWWTTQHPPADFHSPTLAQYRRKATPGLQRWVAACVIAVGTHEPRQGQTLIIFKSWFRFRAICNPTLNSQQSCYIFIIIY